MSPLNWLQMAVIISLAIWVIVIMGVKALFWE